MAGFFDKATKKIAKFSQKVNPASRFSDKLRKRFGLPDPEGRVAEGEATTTELFEGDKGLFKKRKRFTT